MNIVNSISDIRNEMYMLGGSFVQQLATLMRVADYENSAKLIAAFPDIFERYDAHVSVAKKSSEMTTEDEADQAAKLKTQNRTTMNVIQSEISRLRAENAELITALSDCVAVMENELSGLTVIQPELRQAKTALSRRLTDEASAHFRLLELVARIYADHCVGPLMHDAFHERVSETPGASREQDGLGGEIQVGRFHTVAFRCVDSLRIDDPSSCLSASR